MTPKFAEWASWELNRMRDEGTSEQDAARWLEHECGRKGQEFHPEGPGIVASVYRPEEVAAKAMPGDEETPLTSDQIAALGEGSTPPDDLPDDADFVRPGNHGKAAKKK